MSLWLRVMGNRAAMQPAIKALLVAVTLLLVIIALLISALRLLSPYVNSYRSQIAQQIERVSGISLQFDAINPQWRNFNLGIIMESVVAKGQQGEALQAKKITVELDLWRSLLNWRWQFHDLKFDQLRLQLNRSPFKQLGEQDQQQERFFSSQLSRMLLRQFDYFTLSDSQILFPISEQANPTAESALVLLHINELTWLNSGQQHRAKGMITIASGAKLRGQFQLQLDLQDRANKLDSGIIYLQADDMDMQPWLSNKWRSKTGLASADFSLATWIAIKKGQVNRIDSLLKKGMVSWDNSRDAPQQLTVDNLLIRAERATKNDWHIKVPQLPLATNGKDWPKGQLNAWWQPQQQTLRLRTAGLSLKSMMPLLSSLAFLSPDKFKEINQWQLTGEIERLALDLSLEKPLQSPFYVLWNNLHGAVGQGKAQISFDALSGQAAGTIEQGQAQLKMDKGEARYQNMFRAPLQLLSAAAHVGWQHSAEGGLHLWGKGIDLQARSLWFHGGFNFELPAQGKPYLGILGGIRLYDANEAWRYYPEPLMGTPLTDYLGKALQGGRVDNATLLFAGNPQDFPFLHNNGLFQVVVPLKRALFQFDPAWPALNQLNITLDFLNNGLWMWAPELMLGAVRGRQVEAVIPHYNQGKLLVNAKIAGEAEEVKHYFQRTSLKESVADTLDELVLTGEVSGRLHLAIPLQTGGKAVARGAVQLPGNTLLIKALGVELQQLQGEFSFNDGNLSSNTLAGQWSNLPLTLRFDTTAGDQVYQINSELQGHWPLEQLPGLPDRVTTNISGNSDWQSKIKVQLPQQGKIHYQGELSADLRQVISNLPAPFKKSAKTAALWQLTAEGDQTGFTLGGIFNQQQLFNSQWSLGKDFVSLQRGVWSSRAGYALTLPKKALLRANLPAIDGMGLFSLLGSGEQMKGRKTIRWPAEFELSTPALLLAGQQWQQLAITGRQQGVDQLVTLKGRDIEGQLRIMPNNVWDLNLDYFNYNPVSNNASNNSSASNNSNASKRTQEQSGMTVQPEENSFSPRQVPDMQLLCKDCWFFGRHLRRIEAQLKGEGEGLKLNKGLVDSGNTRLQFDAEWQQLQGENQTTLNGTLSGSSIDHSLSYFGFNPAVKKAPFQFIFQLEWQNLPWQPDLGTLSGKLESSMGKGEISVIRGGRTGQLLRLLSFDALLRKLRLDFNDTFGQAFYFDKIHSHSTIKQGLVMTDDLEIDGLAANISMRGTADLVKQRVDAQVTIVPELSTTVGVATAFAVNPLAGAALFAASKVLGPLWSKISLLRYQISGSFDQPVVIEVLRQSRQKNRNKQGLTQ